MFENVDFFFFFLFLTCFTCSVLLKINDNIRKFVPRNFVIITFFDCRTGEVHFNELEKRICRLSAARRGKKPQKLYTLVMEKMNLVKVREFDY